MEVHVEKLMQGKTRITSRDQNRNGICTAHPGDKICGSVGYSQNFSKNYDIDRCKEGGLISGSNVGTRGAKSIQNIHMTLPKQRRAATQETGSALALPHLVYACLATLTARMPCHTYCTHALPHLVHACPATLTARMLFHTYCAILSARMPCHT